MLILNYQKLFAIFESFALSAVSGTEKAQAGGREAWQWRRLVLQAARIPLAQIPWLLTHTASHTASHTGAYSQVYYVWLWPESMQHFNMCVSWRTFACVRQGGRGGTREV